MVLFSMESAGGRRLRLDAMMKDREVEPCVDTYFGIKGIFESSCASLGLIE